MSTEANTGAQNVSQKKTVEVKTTDIDMTDDDREEVINFFVDLFGVERDGVILSG